MNPSFDERIKNLVEAQAPPIGLDEVTGSAPADGAPDNRPPRTRRLLLAAATHPCLVGPRPRRTRQHHQHLQRESATGAVGNAPAAAART